MNLIGEGWHHSLGITLKFVWFLMHWVWGAFYDPEQVLLDGVVVVDVTYVGGLVGNRHWGRKLRAGRGTAGKSPVVGAI